jgi:MFS superfamily sulfate permease-like transporter
MTQEIKQSKGFAQYLPILSWLPNYQRSWLRSDLIAGVVVLTLLVPEGMAYAQMAGLPPETAFYTAPAAMIGYALFSTSRQVITTTTSTIAVMIAAVVGALAVGGSAEYLVLASGLAIMVGLMFLLMGFLRLGFVSEFFSKPVITGFIFGLAMIIAIRQVPKLFGFEVEGGEFL